MTLRGLQRSRPLAQTAGYYLAFIALGLVSASLGPTLPALAELTHSTLRDISLLFSARALGYLAGSLSGGRLYDRIAGHRLMLVVLFVMMAMVLLVPLVSTLAPLIGVMLVLGAAEGGLDVGANTLIVWLHREKVAPFMNGLHFFFGAGSFLAPIIVATVMDWSGGVQWAYWSLAAMLLPCAIWIACWPAPARVRAADTTAPAAAHRLLLPLIVLFFLLYTGAEVGFGGWIYTYVLAAHIGDQATAGYLTASFWGALTLGRLIAIPLAAHAETYTILVVDLLGALLSIVVLLTAGGSLPLTWVGAFGLGLAFASVFPTMLAFAGRRLTITGQLTAWFFVGASAGNTFLPWLIGQFFDAAGPQTMPVIIGSDLLATIVVLAALIRPLSRRPDTGLRNER